MKVEPDPLPLGEFKKEVTKLIDQEVKESSSALDPAAKFLAEFNYKLSVSDGVATLKRTQGKQVYGFLTQHNTTQTTNEGTADSLCVPPVWNSVELSFAVEEEDEEGEKEEEEEESEEEEEETAEEFQAQDVDPLMGVQDLYIPTEVKITIVDKVPSGGRVLFDCQPWRHAKHLSDLAFSSIPGQGGQQHVSRVFGIREPVLHRYIDPPGHTV